jgi:hypothetical protein
MKVLKKTSTYIKLKLYMDIRITHDVSQWLEPNSKNINELLNYQ